MVTNIMETCWQSPCAIGFINVNSRKSFQNAEKSNMLCTKHQEGNSAPQTTPTLNQEDVDPRCLCSLG